MDELTEKEWQKFFELVDKIVNLPRPTYTDKKDLVLQKAKESDTLDNWEELASWFNY